jgi:hypothetical protein
MAITFPPLLIVLVFSDSVAKRNRPGTIVYEASFSRRVSVTVTTSRRRALLQRLGCMPFAQPLSRNLRCSCPFPAR